MSETFWKFNINKLPVEVLLEVFELLDVITLKSTMLVCHQ